MLCAHLRGLFLFEKRHFCAKCLSLDQNNKGDGIILGMGYGDQDIDIGFKSKFYIGCAVFLIQNRDIGIVETDFSFA